MCVHDQVNKIRAYPKSFEAPLNTAPWEVIIGLRNVVEDKETAFPLCGVFFILPEDRGDRVNGLMDAFTGKEGVLGLVKDFMMLKAR